MGRYKKNISLNEELMQKLIRALADYEHVLARGSGNLPAATLRSVAAKIYVAPTPDRTEYLRVHIRQKRQKLLALVRQFNAKRQSLPARLSASPLLAEPSASSLPAAQSALPPLARPGASPSALADVSGSPLPAEPSASPPLADPRASSPCAGLSVRSPSPPRTVPATPGPNRQTHEQPSVTETPSKRPPEALQPGKHKRKRRFGELEILLINSPPKHWQ